MALSLDGTTGISASGNIWGNNIIVPGTLSVGGFSPASISAPGNVTGGNILTAGVVSATGNITGAYILGNGSQLTGVDATQIINGTSNAKVVSSGGNIAVGIGGTSNVAVFATTGQFVTGVISATGNITGSYILGNGSQLTGIDATSIQSGTSNVRVVSSGGDVTTSVGGTSNVIVVSTTGQFVTGVNSVSGNVTGGNILTAGLISATGNVTGNYLLGNGTFITGLSASKIFNGTSEANIGTSGGNANITIGGTANVVVVASTGVLITGVNSVSGNVTGGNILTGGVISATGAITSASHLSLTGNIIDSSELWVNTSSNGNINLNPNGTGQTNIPAGILSVTGNIFGGNIRSFGVISATGGIGGGSITGTGLNVSIGNVNCGNIVNTNANGVGNIGSATTYFNTVFAKATSAQYADLAEMYAADADYAPGTVVCFGGTQEVEISQTSHATTVAGVVSTNPSYIMNAGQSGSHVATVALTGRAPTRVIGTIKKGDRIVTSDVPGVATALDPAKYEPGCIIGKALQSHEVMLDANGNEIPGTIEVVVGRV